MKKYLLLYLLFPLSFYGQVLIKTPVDKQLVARDSTDNDRGLVIIEGEVDKSGTSFEYDKIEVRVFRDGAFYPNELNYKHFYTLDYNGGDIAQFLFDDIKIKSEKANYSFRIYGVFESSPVFIKEVIDVVAGDVYIIQGQSNAVASEKLGSANGNISDFIRVYADGTDDAIDLIANDEWYLADGDGGRKQNGNAGQWGLKLARMLVDSKPYPIAIFNGARGGKSLSYFLEKARKTSDTTNNFDRLLYRLNKTGLKDAVKAVLWSQGENVGGIYSVDDYKVDFIKLKESWEHYYPNIKRYYMFQTINGCGSDEIRIQYSKEAQRQLSNDYNNIHLMNTDGLVQHFDNVHTDEEDYDYCHFVYSDGYEGFAKRIYNLVLRDFYGGSETDIKAPNIISATLVDYTTLEVQTDGTSLYKDADANTFQLHDGNGETITSIATAGSKITFTLSGYPGLGASISNLGADPGVNVGFIRENANDLELLSFYKFPISVAIPNSNIMFTQYFEGNDSNLNRWIEIKNISGAPIPANTYYLALYEDDEISGISNNAPIEPAIPIPEMIIDEVILYRKSGANKPSSENRNSSVSPIDSNICDFSGNDIILISLSNDDSCYSYRQDMLGTIPKSTWGSNTTFMRGENGIPEKDFNVNNWMEFSDQEINEANPNTNLSLGTHGMGFTSWNGSSWTSEEPDKTRTTIISSAYDASSGSIITKDLTITGDLNFFDNSPATKNSVVVFGDLTITEDGSFTIGDTESLVMYDDFATVNGEITKLENSTLRSDLHDVTYWSSSVEGYKIMDAFPGVDPNRIFYYDQLRSSETIPGVGDYWDVWQIATSNMTILPGQGIAAEGRDAGIHDISFKGKPNNGIISVEVFYQNSGNSFNLIGNPYPSAIDIRSFLSQNSNLDGTAYLWTHNTKISAGGDFVADDYASINSLGGAEGALSGGDPPTFNIGSGQGFFVRTDTNEGDGHVEFINSMRIEEANDQFFKQSVSKNKQKTILAKEEKIDRIWINLTTDEGGFSQILLGYKKKLSNKVDKGYDALKFTGSANPISFYSVIQKKKYVIQGQRTFIQRRKAVLGFDTNVAPRTFTISIVRTEGALNGVDVYLVDKYLNVTHNLSESNYIFHQLTPGKFPDRFVLKYMNENDEKNDSPINEEENNFIVSQGLSGITIDANYEVNKISVFNLNGRKYVTMRPKSRFFTISKDKIKVGTIIILEVTFKNGQVLTRKIINQ